MLSACPKFENAFNDPSRGLKVVLLLYHSRPTLKKWLVAMASDLWLVRSSVSGWKTILDSNRSSSERVDWAGGESVVVSIGKEWNPQITQISEIKRRNRLPQ